MAKTALRRGSQEEGNSEYFTGCPIGGGFMWFGLPTKIPSNCRVCDNSTLAIADFAKLNENLGGAWGTSGGNLNIPDLRGRMPRGVDGGAARDPDRSSRVAANTGGNAGDAVGSVQVDAFGSHTHIQDAHRHMGVVNTTDLTNSIDTSRSWAFNKTSGSWGYQGGSSASEPDSSRTSAITPTNQNTGGNESRPKNANVYFVIRVS